VPTALRAVGAQSLLRRHPAPTSASPIPRGFAAPPLTKGAWSIPLRGLDLQDLLRKPWTLTSASPIPRGFAAPPLTKGGFAPDDAMRAIAL